MVEELEASEEGRGVGPGDFPRARIAEWRRSAAFRCRSSCLRFSSSSFAWE